MKNVENYFFSKLKFLPRGLSFILLIACWIALIFGSCHPQADDGKRFFRYNQATGITSLDPAFARDQANIWAVNQLYNGLVQLDNQLNILPCIATRWEISDDGLTYTFYLRQDVYFHTHEVFGGRKRRVTAHDFVYSFNRIIDPAVASPGSWIFLDKIATDTPFHAVDSFTFQLRLKRPFRPLLGILTMPYCFVVPREAVAHYGKDFRIHPVGTGPFMLKDWREGTVLVMVRNPEYFEQKSGRQLPFIDGVRVTFTASRSTEFMQFMKGELDFISGIEQSYINEVLTPEGQLKPELSGKINLYRCPYLNTEYLGFYLGAGKGNPENNPWRIRELRQAVNYGFDRNEMITYLRNGIGIAAESGMVPPGLPGSTGRPLKGYTYDPDKAVELLAAAGFPGGKGLPPLELYTNESYLDLSTFIANQLGNIGIPVKLKTVPAAFQRELMSKGEVPFFRASWIADYPDAESFLALFYSGYGAPPNYTGFHHAAYDSLYLKALAENDDPVRYKLYRQMDSIVIAEAPVVPLYYDEVLRFVRKNVSGLEPNPVNLLILKEVEIH